MDLLKHGKLKVQINICFYFNMANKFHIKSHSYQKSHKPYMAVWSHVWSPGVAGIDGLQPSIHIVFWTPVEL